MAGQRTRTVDNHVGSGVLMGASIYLTYICKTHQTVPNSVTWSKIHVNHSYKIRCKYCPIVPMVLGSASRHDVCSCGVRAVWGGTIDPQCNVVKPRNKPLCRTHANSHSETRLYSASGLTFANGRITLRTVAY
jgi:hypothetical protein